MNWLGRVVNLVRSAVYIWLTVAKMPWASLLFYVFLRFLQGNMGLVGALRSYAWIPIGQYSYRELSTKAFEHVHSLSLDFHISKKTGEVLSALSKGSSINTFLEQVLFQIFPVIVDLGLVFSSFPTYKWLFEWDLTVVLGLYLLCRLLWCLFCFDCACGYDPLYLCHHQNNRLEDWIEERYGR